MQQGRELNLRGGLFYFIKESLKDYSWSPWISILRRFRFGSLCDFVSLRSREVDGVRGDRLQEEGQRVVRGGSRIRRRR